MALVKVPPQRRRRVPHRRGPGRRRAQVADGLPSRSVERKQKRSFSWFLRCFSCFVHTWSECGEASTNAAKSSFPFEESVSQAHLGAAGEMDVRTPLPGGSEWQRAAAPERRGNAATARGKTAGKTATARPSMPSERPEHGFPFHCWGPDRAAVTAERVPGALGALRQPFVHPKDTPTQHNCNVLQNPRSLVVSRIQI